LKVKGWRQKANNKKGWADIAKEAKFFEDLHSKNPPVGQELWFYTRPCMVNIFQCIPLMLFGYGAV
jgi:hypothetical protein